MKPIPYRPFRGGEYQSVAHAMNVGIPSDIDQVLLWGFDLCPGMSGLKYIVWTSCCYLCTERLLSLTINTRRTTAFVCTASVHVERTLFMFFRRHQGRLAQAKRLVSMRDTLFDS